MLKPNSPVTTNLIKARELIADENNWCTDIRRQTTDGHVQHCALGALDAVTGLYSGPDNPEVLSLIKAARELSPNSEARADWLVAEVNNTLGHAAVMSMFNRAIELSLQTGSD